MVRRIYEKIACGEKKFEQLLVRVSEAETDKLSPFIDLSVYSRNRTFRIFRSSKCGKEVELVPTRRYLGALWHARQESKGQAEEEETDRLIECGGRSAAEVDDQALFLRSLICNVSANCEALHCDEVLEAASTCQQYKPLSALDRNNSSKQPLNNMLSSRLRRSERRPRRRRRRAVVRRRRRRRRRRQRRRKRRRR